MTGPAAPIDLSRERFEILQSIGSADYLHMALLDEVELWQERCANFEGKQELVDHLNDVLKERDRLREQNAAMLEALKVAKRELAVLHTEIAIVNTAITAAEQEPDNG